MQSIHERFITELEHLSFTGEISITKTDREEHASDESLFYIEPQVVIYPKDTADISRAITVINQLNTAENPIHLTPRAAGTGLSGGSLNDSVCINTTRYFNTIHSVEKTGSGATMVVDPGVYYRDLEKEMDAIGVYIPSHPASKDICTVGGMVGNNAAGPDTLRYGHTAEFTQSMDVVLADGNEYTLQPLEWSKFETELKRDDHLGVIYRHIWELLLHEEEFVLHARPKTQKNSAGYALWDALSTTVEEFMKGRGVFDLGRVITGSQGTLGVITRLTMTAVPKNPDDTLIAIPIFDLDQCGSVINELLKYKPHSVEIFDQPTYQASLRNPGFFKQRLSGLAYYQFLVSLYSTVVFRFAGQTPQFVILASLESNEKTDLEKLNTEIQQEFQTKSWIVTSPTQAEMLWQIRRASYLLSKLQSANMRPAAFLEDMAVPPKNLPAFFKEIKELFTKYKFNAFIHGHGGNGHLHFYPLMDFTDPQTAELIPTMAEDFFSTATKHGGNICGEHNDGIIRTPYLNLVFSPEAIDMFTRLEHVFDPHNIFNPGKKVEPKFDIKKNIRHTN